MAESKINSDNITNLDSIISSDNRTDSNMLSSNNKKLKPKYARLAKDNL
ncbi:10626_t:CDS:1, partial [Racocetra fulgida]